MRNYFERLSLEDIDEDEEQERLEQKLEKEVAEEALLMSDKKLSVGGNENKPTITNELSKEGRSMLIKEEMRAKKEMQATGIRKKMSLNNFDNLPRDMFDRARRASPRAAANQGNSPNLVPAPDMATKDLAESTMVTAGIGKDGSKSRQGSTAITSK